MNDVDTYGTRRGRSPSLRCHRKRLSPMLFIDVSHLRPEWTRPAPSGTRRCKAVREAAPGLFVNCSSGLPRGISMAELAGRARRCDPRVERWAGRGRRRLDRRQHRPATRGRPCRRRRARHARVQCLPTRAAGAGDAAPSGRTHPARRPPPGARRDDGGTRSPRAGARSPPDSSRGSPVHACSPAEMIWPTWPVTDTRVGRQVGVRATTTRKVRAAAVGPGAQEPRRRPSVSRLDAVPAPAPYGGGRVIGGSVRGYW